MSTDRILIFASAGLRAIAVGLSGVILALYLVGIGLNASSIGLVVSSGLAGCAVGTFLVTAVSDRLGRRLTLVMLAALMALGGLTLCVTTHHAVVLLSAFVGMVNGMGRDRGAGLTVEQVMLPQTAAPSRRTAVFA
ncbi:MAG: MFS transporter, partial [Candidatus Omnitrophica bacterium]|nr:MFS transporter [Candidatus Omnitrophota bacterium]